MNPIRLFSPLPSLVLLAGIGTVLLLSAATQTQTTRPTKVVLQDSVIQLDPATGLKIAPGLDMVRAQCTGCHSSRLIIQYRATREGWKERIRWMQQKQNLWDLGEAEPVILDYLAKNYGPEPKELRRESLQPVQWYKLNE